MSKVSAINNIVRDMFLQDTIENIKSGKEKLDLKQELHLAAAERDASRGIVKGRKEAFANPQSTWEHMEQGRRDGVIITQPRLEAYNQAQQNMQAFQKEHVKQILRQYCNRLLTLADSFLVGLDTLDFDSQEFAEFLEF
jgi:hypothetical protein